MAKKPPLGSGRRFSKQEASAIMANAGRAKYGDAKMNKMAQAGKKRAKK